MNKKYRKFGLKNRKDIIRLIESYFSEAKKSFKTNKKQANDFVRKARRLSMKFKIKLKPELKRRFCKNCYSFLMPGINVRIRTREGKIIYYCLECKKFMRIPFDKKKK